MRPTFAPKRTTPPRGNIAAVYFAITRKYGYTRLESELAHSINVYCRALQRAPSTTPCSNEEGRAPISWDLPDARSNSARYNVRFLFFFFGEEEEEGFKEGVCAQGSRVMASRDSNVESRSLLLYSGLPLL